MIFKVKDIINTEYAVAAEDGDKIFELVKTALIKKHFIIIDFNDLDLITTAFLNNAIGNLYDIFDSTLLNEKIELRNLTSSDLELLAKVIKVAKAKYKPDVFEEVIEDGDH